MPKRLITLLAAVALAAAAPAVGCGGDSDDSGGMAEQAKPAVTIGTKNFPEQLVLGELYAQALRKAGYKVVLKSDIGATEIVHRALQRGTLDLYPEYIGVIASELAGETKRAKSASEVYRTAQRFEESKGFTLLEPTPFQNRDAIAVKPSFARRYKLKAIGDLAKVPGSVSIAAPPEFRTRFEGYIGLRRLYGADNLRFMPMPIGDQYRALDTGSIDAADVFTTDGELDRGDYVVLDDPRSLFGFQHVAPLVSQKVLEQQGEGFARTLNAVSAKLTTSAMRRMNSEVRFGRRQPADVAADFLGT
jgi:osmoprotectant transport system substrate-binding protein